MVGTFLLVEIMAKISQGEDVKSWIMQSYDNEISRHGEQLIDGLCQVIPMIERFNEPKGLDHWVLEINQTEDEGIELVIHHDQLELLAFLMEDDDEYSVEDITENMSIDTIFLPHYHIFLANPQLQEMLIDEIKLWEVDSEYHPSAINHIEIILDEGYNLATFGGNKKTPMELSWDIDEIFIGATDNDSMSSNPDYHLAHEHFDMNEPEDSLELGLQSWSEFDEEDDDWDDIGDDDFEDDFADDDWDGDVEEEWDPGFDDEED